MKKVQAQAKHLETQTTRKPGIVQRQQQRVGNLTVEIQRLTERRDALRAEVTEAATVGQYGPLTVERSPYREPEPALAPAVAKLKADDDKWKDYFNSDDSYDMDDL
jgi:hypothetical protein